MKNFGIFILKNENISAFCVFLAMCNERVLYFIYYSYIIFIFQKKLYIFFNILIFLSFIIVVMFIQCLKSYFYDTISSVFSLLGIQLLYHIYITRYFIVHHFISVFNCFYYFICCQISYSNVIFFLFNEFLKISFYN